MEDLKRLQVNAFYAWLGRTFLKLLGWKQVGEVPDVPKAVLVVAHHTSNWDFPIGLALSFQMRISPFWMGKHTLFKKPFGGFMKWLGGVPIMRSKAHNVVEQAAQVFASQRTFWLVVTPEGTRSKVNHWKAGFYRIAAAAKVPILFAFLDYTTKTGGIGLQLIPGDDINADMERIREFYKGVHARFPENAGEVRLRDEPGSVAQTEHGRADD